MIIPNKEFVDLLCDLKISPNQFLICMLIHDKDVAATIKYYEENGENKFDFKDIELLLKRGFIIRISKDEKHYHLDQFITTDLFSGGFLVDNEEAGEELWDAYPNWMHFNNTKPVAAKSCDKDDLIEKYGKKIKGSKKKHKEIMDILAKYNDQTGGNPGMGIEKFVVSEHWNALKELYEQEGTGDLIRDL